MYRVEGEGGNDEKTLADSVQDIRDVMEIKKSMRNSIEYLEACALDAASECPLRFLEVRAQFAEKIAGMGRCEFVGLCRDIIRGMTVSMTADDDFSLWRKSLWVAYQATEIEKENPSLMTAAMVEFMRQRDVPQEE